VYLTALSLTRSRKRVKYGRESRETRNQGWLCWRGPVATYSTDRSQYRRSVGEGESDCGPVSEWMPARVTPGREGVTSSGQTLLSPKRKPHLRTRGSLGRKKITAIYPDGTWNQDHVGEDQQLIRPDSEYRQIASYDWIIVNNGDKKVRKREASECAWCD
jgi:hypothetical protein